MNSFNASKKDYPTIRTPLLYQWSIFGDYLTILKYEFNFEILSFVLMSNHFQILIKTPDANLSEGMNYFMREVSKEMSAKIVRINQTFGGPYHWCLLDSYKYFLNSYKYPLLFKNVLLDIEKIRVRKHFYSIQKLSINADLNQKVRRTASGTAYLMRLF